VVWSGGWQAVATGLEDHVSRGLLRAWLGMPTRGSGSCNGFAVTLAVTYRSST
jgi:hypothetical protein